MRIYSLEEYERVCEFVRKVKEIDEQRNHRGIYLQYTTAMNLYHSGSLSLVGLRNRITTIFKNCDVLLAAFDRTLKDLGTLRDKIVVDPSNLERIKEFLKSLRSKGITSRVLREAFERHKEHKDVQILKKEVNLVLRDYPYLKEEFRLILVDHGLIQDKKPGGEITREEEDELFKDDMYFHAIEAAITFAVAEDNKKPEVGVYGAIRRFYKERRRALPRGIMKDPKLAVRRILPDLQRKYYALLKNRRNSLEKVRKVNESLVVVSDL